MAKGRGTVAAKTRTRGHGQRRVPVEYVVPEDIDILYADGTFITLSNGTFIISFVQTSHPLVVTEADARAVKRVSSKCVARIALSPDRFASTLEIMQKQFKGFVDQIPKSEE